MVKKEQKKHTPEPEKSDKRYLKKFEIVETDVELPIQGQVRDPEDLYKFLKDLENESVSKVIGIYLDDKNLFLGHQVIGCLIYSNFLARQIHIAELLNFFKQFLFNLALDHTSLSLSVFYQFLFPSVLVLLPHR
ncbi:MAG TPA: hypothetical protein PLK76_03750 [bacterium]|nr:hypothetical protein [bacterium]